MRFRCLCYFTFLILFGQQVHAADRELSLKAGLVFNFARYSQNQGDTRLNTINSTNSDYVICSASPQFIEVAQNVLANKRIGQQALTLKQISYTNNELNQCQIIFFESEALFQQFLEMPITTKPMLIGHIDNFIDLGGHINFIYVGGKIRFEISPEQLAQSGIKVSSKVIRLGKVKTGGAE